jgi:hypothetical protein
MACREVAPKAKDEQGLFYQVNPNVLASPLRDTAQACISSPEHETSKTS